MCILRIFELPSFDEKFIKIISVKEKEEKGKTPIINFIRTWNSISSNLTHTKGERAFR